MMTWTDPYRMERKINHKPAFTLQMAFHIIMFVNVCMLVLLHWCMLCFASLFQTLCQSFVLGAVARYSAEILTQ